MINKTAVMSALVISMIAGAVNSGPAIAQNAADDATPAHEGGGKATLEEIVVTARKREENLQDVPVAVTAISGAEIQRKGIPDTVALSGTMPNLFLKQNPTPTVSSSIYIRGIGQDESHFTQEPGVGLYIDGVFYSRSSGSIVNLVDIDRVEVLRGPQGTLFGRNSPAGAISIVTRAPSFDGFNAHLEGSEGNYSNTTLRGSANFVLIDHELAAKVDFFSRNEDGFMVNGFSSPGIGQQKFNGLDKQAGRLSLLYQPTEKLRVRVTGDVSRDRSQLYAPTFVTASPDGTVTYANGSPYISFVQPQFGLPAVFNGYSGSVTADYALNSALSLKYIGAYRSYYHFLAGELFGAEAFPLGLQRTQRGKMNQQELQANYTAERFVAVAGAIYYRDVVQEEAYNEFAGGADLYPVSHQTSDSYAGYAEGTYKVLDSLSLTTGGRYTKDKKRLRRKSTDLPGLAGANVAFDMDDEHSTSAFTPRVILDFKPLVATGAAAGELLSDLLLYASWAKGYKAGAFSTGFTDNQAQARTFLAPEHVRTYEAGFKSEWFDRRAKLNVTYFYTDYTDLQIRNCQFATPAGCEPLGLDVRMKGIELESRVNVTAGLSANLSIATLSPTYTKPAPGSTRLQNTPPLTYDIEAEYHHEVPNAGSVFTGADWRWTAGFSQAFSDSPQTYTSRYGLLSARLGYTSADGHWTVKLSGDNLTNKFYVANAIDGGNLGAQWLGRPREYMVTGEYRFE